MTWSDVALTGRPDVDGRTVRCASCGEMDVVYAIVVGLAVCSYSCVLDRTDAVMRAHEFKHPQEQDEN